VAKARILITFFKSAAIMIISRNIKWNLILFYTWKSLLYYTLLSIGVYLLHDHFKLLNLSIPFTTITAISTALAIYLGFKNNNAYERWAEARKLWGSLINYSRVLVRQINCLVLPGETDQAEATLFRKRILLRHIAWVNALRVLLRNPNGFNITTNDELYEDSNEYEEIRKFCLKLSTKLFIPTGMRPTTSSTYKARK